MSNAVDIALTLEDPDHMWHTGAASAQFRSPDQAGRFECHVHGLDGRTSTLDGHILICLRAFDAGSLLWCDSYAEALLLSKVHLAHGRRVCVMWDMGLLNWVVLTTAPLH